MTAEELARRMANDHDARSRSWPEHDGHPGLLPYARALIEAQMFMDELEVRDHSILGPDDYQAAEAWMLKATLDALLVVR